MAFRKVERSYDSTPNGWRLATFEEARDGLETIKKQNLLNKWDRVRLLDGWITGPGYKFEMDNSFKGCLGYMLLIQAESSGGAYADVHLSDRGKEVALLLCVDDWNYEVVYWLLNFWSTSQTMNIGDVRGGNIPFSNVAKDEFVGMNKMVSILARKLGEEGGASLEKAGETKYSGKDSIKEMLSGMIKIVTEEEDIVQFIGRGMWHFTWYEGEEYCLPDSVTTEVVGESYWSFVCDSFAGYVVEVCGLTSLLEILQMKTKSTSQKNFMTATSILLYLSDFRTDIIHEPLAHHCSNSCAEKILRYTLEKAQGVPQSFNGILQRNAMWRCYDETGNYDVLSKLLFIVAKGKYAHMEQGKNIAGTVVDMLMKCGAQPGKCYAIGKYQKKNALHFAAKFHDEDVGIEIAKALICGNDEQSIDEFVNAADERGRTALHRASERGNARICGLLVDRGASLTAQDEMGMTALHYALEGEIDEVIDVLVKSPYITESVDLKTKEGYTPLDIAVARMDEESTAKLLSKSNVPEAYFHKVDEEQLLRNSLLLGSVDIVGKLFQKGIRLPAGDCDEDGKTALHLAAICDNESNAIEIIYNIDGFEQNKVAKQDRRGRTVLHEAALKGHVKLCHFLLDVNPKLIYMKDRDGQNPLYDAVKGESASTNLYKKLLAAYFMKDKPEDELTDRNGLTPLHVAASQGKGELVKELLSSDKIKTKYLRKGDIHAQTALHKAVKRGDVYTVEILLKNGAHPLRERDCDGKTALHYAVQAETEHKEELARMLFRRCETYEEKSLLFWASAAGLGTAEDLIEDPNTDDPLHKFFVATKKSYKEGNLLKMAACLGDIEMTKELISRGYQIGDIRDSNWKSGLTKAKKENVERVSRQIEMIKEQGNDKPAVSDTLGRLDYAQGLAALFLNPYIKPPIAVGITGSWGMGKSSLMVQTERILLTTAAQMALFPSSKLSSSELPDIKPCELSRKGKRKLGYIYKQIKFGERVNRNIFAILWDYIKSKFKKTSVDRNILVILRDYIKSMLHKTSVKDIQKELEKFLNEYDLKNLKVFKALAAMDSSDMLKNSTSRPKADPSTEENVSAVLTVQYNAWKYRNETEALAGIAVEVTKELEGIMTQAQWLNTCWRNTWKKKKYTLWIEIFFPSLLALVLVSSFTWITWVVLDSDKLKEWGKAKYAWPPAALVIIVWTLTKSIMGILKPVSTQLMQYISFPDHTDKLGYQERVISDISFLKDEIGKKANWLFIVFAWVLTTFKVIWGLITESCITSLIFHNRSHEKAIEAPKVAPASGSNLRIIVFVDDLDRCKESVILQVLSAVNLVLAVCEISVVMGMDKRLIKRAIKKKYKDAKANESLKDKQELADMYLQKIIQLPLDLPDPSDEESRRFLKGQLGVLENENVAFTKDDGSLSGDDGERAAVQRNIAAQVEINVPESEITEMGKDQSRSIIGPTNLRQPTEPTERRTRVPSQTDGYATVTSVQQNLTSSILIREMLFVKYSQGEERAFLYFQGLATDCRKLPREWKRLLNYHRLVWYIFSVTKEAKKLAGWQVQLITWIFVCWEWKENMNLVIEKWRESGNKFLTSESNDPSLLMIVEHLMKEHERETPKVTVTSKGEDGPEWTQKLGEPGGTVGEITNDEETESGSTELEKMNEDGESSVQKITNGEEYIPTIADDIENLENTPSQKLANDMKSKLDELEKSLAELKREMKELKELVSDDLKNDIKELKKQLSEELKGDIKDVKEQIAKKDSGKNEENLKKRNREFHENWKRMKSILEKYDVSMDGIQAFQRFRFYCIAGYLPRPSSRG